MAKLEGDLDPLWKDLDWCVLIDCFGVPFPRDCLTVYCSLLPSRMHLPKLAMQRPRPYGTGPGLWMGAGLIREPSRPREEADRELVAKLVYHG